LYTHIIENNLLNESEHTDHLLNDLDCFVSESEGVDNSMKSNIIKETYKLHLEQISIDFHLALTSILDENLWSNLDVLIDNELSVLRNKRAILFAPILFSNSHWKRIIKHELSILKNKDLIDLSISDFQSCLMELFRKVENLDHISNSKFLKGQLKALNENLKLNKGIFKLFDLKTLKSKEAFLNNLSADKILSESKIKPSKKEVKLIKKSRVELTNSKNIYRIIKGLSYLIRKQNPHLSGKESTIHSKNIAIAIFNTDQKESNNNALPKEITFNNRVLMEFLFFLDNKGYIIGRNISLPKIIHGNLIFNRRGFSVQNLYLLTKDIKEQSTLTFNGLTSTMVLENEMKY